LTIYDAKSRHKTSGKYLQNVQNTIICHNELVESWQTNKTV